jgi:hypothetical protein
MNLEQPLVATKRAGQKIYADSRESIEKKPKVI